MQHLTRLAGHLGWADRRAIDALRSAPGTDAQALEVLAHVLGAEHVWLARLRGETPTLAVWPALSVDDCERVAADNLAALERYVAALGPDDLARGITYRNSAGDQFTSTVEDIILHVCLHGAYHRGQVAAAIRRGGAAPQPTDYIAYIRGAPAAVRH